MVVPLQFAIPASELRSIEGELATASKKVTWLQPPEQGTVLSSSLVHLQGNRLQTTNGLAVATVHICSA